MAEKGPPAPTPKPGKTKITVAKQTDAKTNIPLEPKILIRPIDYQQDQNALYPSNQLAQLPEQPPILPNPPNPPPLPTYSSTSTKSSKSPPPPISPNLED